MKDTWEGQYAIYGMTKEYNGVTVGGFTKTGRVCAFDIEFENSKEIWVSKLYGELLEIHGMTIANEKKYKRSMVINNPVYEQIGTGWVGRVKTSRGLGVWVYGGDYRDTSDCARNCANDAAAAVRMDAGFRYALAAGYRYEPFMESCELDNGAECCPKVTAQDEVKSMRDWRGVDGEIFSDAEVQMFQKICKACQNYKSIIQTKYVNKR